MGSFSEQTTIEAPRERVWEVLADLGSIDRWNPGVKHSRTTSEASEGEGATRHCDLQRPNGRPAGSIEERAFDWRPGEGYRIEITGGTLPFERAVISFALGDAGRGTSVTVSPEYELRYGRLGRALDALAVRRQYRKGMRGLLLGLKRDVERGAAGRPAP